MEYKIGNTKYVNHKGETQDITCPSCNKKVNFSVFDNSEINIMAKLPLIEKNNIYFLVCPNCASIYGVNSVKGDAFTKGSKLSIGDFDLNDLIKFND